MKRFLSILLAAIILSFNRPDLSIAEGIAREGTTEDDAAIEAAAEEGPQGNPAPIELSPTTYRLGGFPRAAALSDIDSDGNLDLVVTTPEKHGFTILSGKGGGTFEIGKDYPYPIEGYPLSIISADIDGDSTTDLVVLDSYGKVRTFLNKGDGTFSPGRAYPVEDYSFSISASDVNRDGAIDLIVLSANTHTILLNDGKGGFDTILSYPGGVNSPAKITADLNDDARYDMIIGDQEGVSVLLNNGNETFASGVAYPTGKMPVAAAMGDLDSDNEDDLIVANYLDHTITILRSNGDGTFQGPINYPSGKGPNSITLGDIDGDEDEDMIVTNGMSGDVTVFINNTVRPLEVLTDSLPQGRRGSFYETRLEAKGGVPPYNWAVVSGSLPPTLHLDPSTGGVVSLSKEHGEGIASEGEVEGEMAHGENMGEPLPSMDPPCYCLKAPTGLYRFTVQVADSAANRANVDLSIEVLPQPGTVSGKISYLGEKNGKIWIGLWPLSRARSMESFIGPMYTATMDTPGEYKIENIYPEAYRAGAFLDINGDGRRGGDEPYGTFTPKGSGGEPQTTVVDGNGAEVTGIDIELK